MSERLHPPESLSPREALAEECPDCEGHGWVYATTSLGEHIEVRCEANCNFGRRIRTTHEPASGIGYERPPDKDSETHGQLYERAKELRAEVARLQRELDYQKAQAAGAMPLLVQWARDVALEEAAKMAEVYACAYHLVPPSFQRLAEAIRSLKSRRADHA